MNKKLKLLLGLVLFIIVFVGVKFTYDNLKKTVKVETPKQEETAHKQSDVSVMTQPNDPYVFDKEGKKIQLSSLSEKPKVYFFWASWCHYCQASFPSYIELYEKYKNQVDFAFIDVPDGQRETKETALKFLEKHNYNVPVYFDSDLDYADKYSIYAFPATIMIRNGNRFNQLIRGAQPKETFEQLIQELLQ